MYISTKQQKQKVVKGKPMQNEYTLQLFIMTHAHTATQCNEML